MSLPVPDVPLLLVGELAQSLAAAVPPSAPQPIPLDGAEALVAWAVDHPASCPVAVAAPAVWQHPSLAPLALRAAAPRLGAVVVAEVAPEPWPEQVIGWANPTDPNQCRAVLQGAIQAQSASARAWHTQAQTAKKLEDFVYTVTHDLKGPLQGVVGLSGLVMELEGHRLSEEGRGFLARVENSGEFLARMFDELLRYSRLGRHGLQRAEADLTELAQRAFADAQHVRPRPNVTLQMEGLGPAHVDPSLVEAALTALFDNALRLLPESADSVRVAWEVHPEGGGTLSVSDDGPGLPETALERVFRIFVRHHDTGMETTGVGLALVDKAATMHGGRAWATSAGDGQGATFHMRLP